MQASDCDEFECGATKVPCGSTASNIIYEKNALKSYLNNDWSQQLVGTPLANTPALYFETVDAFRYMKLKDLDIGEEKLYIFGWDSSDPE